MTANRMVHQRQEIRTSHFPRGVRQRNRLFGVVTKRFNATVTRGVRGRLNGDVVSGARFLWNLVGSAAMLMATTVQSVGLWLIVAHGA